LRRSCSMPRSLRLVDGASTARAIVMCDIGAVDVGQRFVGVAAPACFIAQIRVELERASHMHARALARARLAKPGKSSCSRDRCSALRKWRKWHVLSTL
jgi:hypothetical protein